MIGAMRERLVVQLNDPPSANVTSLTRSSTTATCTTAVPHGFLATDYVTIAGSTIAGWNAKVKIVTTPTSTTFTFTCSSGLTTPATGTMTVVYTSNAQGGAGANGSLWRTLDTVPAEMIPLKASERLQLAAIQSDTTYRFRVRARSDLSPTMRLLWNPTGPVTMPRKTLAITGVIPADSDLRFQFLEAAEVAA